MTDKTYENTQQNNEVMTSDVPCDGTLNTLKPEEKKEKMFTQSQLEEVVRERIQRERKVNESLSSVKRLLKNACDKGLINGSSYAEMAKDLVEKLGGASSKAQLSDGESKTHTEDKAPMVADIGQNNDVCHADGEENKQEAKPKDMSFLGVLSDIRAKYPGTAVEKMLSGEGFERFAKGRNGDIREIFDDYYDFMSVMSQESVKNTENGNHSELCSTGFSSFSGASDAGANLTKQQMDIAKSAGMSYREYQNLLESIPKRTGRTF